MTIDFDKARAGESAFVYVCPPGDEHGWVTDPEWWNDIDEPVTVVRQQWQLVHEDKVTFHDRTELCPECNGDGAAPNAQDIDDIDVATEYALVATDCSRCGGDGRHPLAGQMEVHE